MIYPVRTRERPHVADIPLFLGLDLIAQTSALNYNPDDVWEVLWKRKIVDDDEQPTAQAIEAGHVREFEDGNGFTVRVSPHVFGKVRRQLEWWK